MITMTTNQIKSMFRGNHSDATVDISTIVDLGQMLPINGKITEDGMDYYYSIDLLEFTKSNVSDEIIKDMLTQGWTLDKREQNIIKFC